MATKDDEKDPELDSADGEDGTVDAQFEPDDDASASPDAEDRALVEDSAGLEHPEEEQRTPAQLGATKYVHAAFFAAGMLTAFIAGKLLGAVWNSLAAWPAAVRAVPQLLRYAEDERGSITMVGGALIGVITIIQIYRRERIRRWADEVAMELSKCAWPDRETVTNGTMVCVVATLIATTYVALLDRLWGFLTTLVYGA